MDKGGFSFQLIASRIFHLPQDLNPDCSGHIDGITRQKLECAVTCIEIYFQRMGCLADDSCDSDAACVSINAWTPCSCDDIE